MKLKNKCAVITGGASGIGKELALQLAQKHNCLVHVIDNHPKNLEQLQKHAAKYNLSIEGHLVDITEYTQATKVFDRLFAEQKIDLWFNNAGVVSVGEFSQQTHEQIDKMLQVNVHAVCQWTHYSLVKMQQQGGGQIINMASFSGITPAPYISLYSACKHAVVGLTRSLQEELRQTNSFVKLTLIAPGFVKTPLIEQEFPKALQWMLASAPRTAATILSGIQKDKLEIIPDLNGKMMQLGHKWVPKTMLRSTKVLRKLMP